MARDGRPPQHGFPEPPPALRAAAAERYGEIVAAASGRVFGLPDTDVDAALSAESERGARYDTVLSFMRTPRVADFARLVAALEQILADEGRIHMVEPSEPGVTGSLGGLRSHRLRRRRSDGCRADRDIVAALRSGGFTVTDLHRRQAASVPRRWRRYVELQARRETPRRETPRPAGGRGVLSAG